MPKQNPRKSSQPLKPKSLPWKCWWNKPLTKAAQCRRPAGPKRKKSTFQTVRHCLPTPLDGLTSCKTSWRKTVLHHRFVANCMFDMVRGELVVYCHSRVVRYCSAATVQRGNRFQPLERWEGIRLSTFCQTKNNYEILPELRWKQDRWVIPGPFSDGDTKRGACSAENHVSPYVGIWCKDYIFTNHDQEVSPWLPWFLEAPSTSWARLLSPPYQPPWEHVWGNGRLTRVTAWWGSLYMQFKRSTETCLLSMEWNLVPLSKVVRSILAHPIGKDYKWYISGIFPANWGIICHPTTY